MDKEILTLADASELLSLPEAEVARLLAEGELPGRRIGPHWYLSRTRLLQFIAGADPHDPAPQSPPGEMPKPLPPRLLAPNWRCETCEAVYPPELVECARCGTARNAPLLGYRLPRPADALGSGPGRKVN